MSPFLSTQDAAATRDLEDMEDLMADLEKGITQNGSGYAGKSWNILGQVYFPKAVCELTFAFRDEQRTRAVRARPHPPDPGRIHSGAGGSARPETRRQMA